MRRLVAILSGLLVVVGVFTLSACGEEKARATGETTTIKVTVQGQSIDPHGKRIKVPVGNDVKFEVTADAPGEIHVHSSPEKTLEYKAGTTVLELGALEKHGMIEVESHTLDKPIVELQVN